MSDMLRLPGSLCAGAKEAKTFPIKGAGLMGCVLRSIEKAKCP